MCQLRAELCWGSDLHEERLVGKEMIIQHAARGACKLVMSILRQKNYNESWD